MKSSGDSWTPDALWRKGVGASVSVGGEGSCRMSRDVLLTLGDSVTERETKLGRGKADGAGDAWKVAPAKADTDFMDED